MKRSQLLMACLVMLTLNLSAQYYTDWIRPADNYLKTGSMTARDNEDNLIVTGYIPAQNIYTRKYDKAGSLLWERSSTSGIQSNYEKSVWVNTDNNSNVFVTGFRYSVGSGRLFPNAVIALKYNAAGTLLWKKSIAVSVLVGGSVPAFNLRSEVDANGNLYIGTAAASPSGFILYKFNPSGTLVFTKNSTLNAPGGFSTMRLKGSKILFAGRTGSLSSALITVWDTTGRVLFSKAVQGQGGNDVEIDGIGNAYLLSSYPNLVSASSGQDIVMYKFNTTGAQTWKKNFDFGGQDFPTRFVFAANKISVIGYGSVGGSYFDWITFQTNTDGIKQWSTKYNGTRYNDEQPAFIAAKDNGEVYVTGKGGPSPSAMNLSNLRMITLKYSNTGVVKWVDSLNYYNGWGVSCTLAKDSSLYVLSSTNITAYHFLDQAPCNVPSNVNVSAITATGAAVSWAAVAGAASYHVRYKVSSAVDWTIVSTTTPTLNLTGLIDGTTYSISVQTVCNNGLSGYSADQSFSTPIAASYCAAGGLSVLNEAISSVWISAAVLQPTQEYIDHQFGLSSGYSDYTALNASLNYSDSAIVVIGASGSDPTSPAKYCSMWIDYNQDKDILDPGETIFSNLVTTSGLGTLKTGFRIPQSALTGSTRVRVTLSNDLIVSPCGTYPRGETEDYTITILSNTVAKKAVAKIAKAALVDIVKTGIYPNPVEGVLYLKGLPQRNNKRNIEIYDVTGRRIKSDDISQSSINVIGLKAGVYVIRILEKNAVVYTSRFVKK